MKLHPAIRALLLPASWVFEVIVRLRAWLFRIGVLSQKRLNGVVISVGNLTIGGTGKTPMVMWLAQRLFDRGKRVGILSRGYRGRVLSDAELTAAGADSSVVMSDETWMMKRAFRGRAHLGVGADRYEHGKILERAGTEWFLLDDGFQHLNLYRDVDIVLVDATDPLGGGALLPAGRQREPTSALARADIVVITRSHHAPAIETLIRRFTDAPLFYAQPDLEEICPEQHSIVQGELGEWLGRKIFAFCAIGNPAAFFEDVQRWGMSLAGQMAFPDHHSYTRADAAEIERRARDAGAEVLLCTAKDTFNLAAVRFRGFPLFACRITMKVSEPDEFWRALDAVLERKRAEKAR